MPITQRDAVAKLIEAPAPVLFIDTCIFLDVLRAPIRENINASSTELAQKLHQLSIANPPNLWLVTSETVQAEWLENILDVKTEVEREILKLERKRRHFIYAAEAANNVKYQYGRSECSLSLESRLESISRTLLQSCLVIKPEDIHMLNAMNRVKSYSPPSRRGKSEPKDCEIFEVFLGLCRDSRAAGFTEKLLFVSSNTTDYGGVNESAIKSELQQFNAEIVANLPWATSLIQ